MRWLAYIMMVLGACGGSTPALVFSDPEKLAAAYDLYDAPHKGDVVLERTIKVTVDSAVKPSDAESRFEVQVALGRYTPTQEPLAVDLVTPEGARLESVAARLDGTPVQPLTAGPGNVAVVDPGQVGWRFTFGAPSAAPATANEQLILEVIVRFTLEGTLASDAQWVATADTDTVLIRYDLPGDVQGTFQVVGSDLKPIVASQNGRTVIALLVRNAFREAAKAGRRVYARYATLRASPKGYEQRYADTWATATRDYAERLVDESDTLDDGYDAPFKPTATATDAMLHEIYQFVQGRPQRPDALAATWDAARALKEPLEKNDLTATDKVHLLHWLLREAKVPHRFAIARPKSYEPIASPSIPVVGAFTTPLIFAFGLWLDPACTTCTAGTVRPELAGAQVLLLPVAGEPELTTLPTETR